jgi:SH3-like domain-containing protein
LQRNDSVRRLPRFSLPILLLISIALLPGCSRFHHDTTEYVYVSARQVYLHDRVAAVSNRVGQVTNGEALQVVEHGKRFTKVRTPKGEIGWLENHSIIDDKLYAQFAELDKQHHPDLAVARGQLRDDLYLHLLPGRETAHFLVLAGSTKVDLLVRGSLAKAAAPGAPVQKPATPSSPEAASAPAPPVMEDWWLVRDGSGHCGWLLARQLDIDVPDEVAIYSESQRMIAAYPIAKVMDSGVEHERKSARKGQKNETAKKDEDAQADAASAPAATEHTEYLTVLAPPRGGLPFDFDQVRLFTWSLNHHRYETAYRLHGIRGYLPVKISQETQNGQTMPVFSFAIADSANANITVDPDTGVTRPSAPRTLTFRLEGNLVRRIGPDMAPIILTHEGDEPGKTKPAKGKRR